MCGFAGYIDLQGRLKADKNILVGMTEKIFHRGPDSSGYFVEKNIGIGFRRLSIIDLQTGDQPIYNEDHSIVIVCNGEIYNYLELRSILKKKGHKFRTHSDVEVLLHLYEEKGVELLNELNGQFAFALYDKKKKRLFLARDHFGIAPLYYTNKDGVFIFSSEIKAILEYPSVTREVDLTGLDQVFSFPGLVSPKTMFKNIESLKSGYYILVENDAVKIKEYWDLDYPKDGDISYYKPESYYIDKLKDLFLQSVKYRLQADVPVGFYLSGGLDSALTAAMIKKASLNNKMDSFSICFKDKEIDESKYQKVIAKKIISTHHEILFDWAEIYGKLSRIIYHTECPVKESYNTCALALSELTKKTGIKVILTGQGADELFGGYIGYRFDRFRAKFSQKNNSETRHEEELREKLWGDKYLFYENKFHELKKIKTGLYSKRSNELFQDFDCLNFELINKDRIQGRHSVHKRSYLDFKLRLADHLLSDHGDKMNLANSVEGRFPFLDINLVEFAKVIPPDLKIRGYTEKYILKKIAQEFVPQEIIDREKFAFRAPSSPYLLQQNTEWINDLLSYERIKKQGYFNPDTVERLKTQYSQKGFQLHPHHETDLLMIVLTFNILLDLFDLPNLN